MSESSKQTICSIITGPKDAAMPACVQLGMSEEEQRS